MTHVRVERETRGLGCLTGDAPHAGCGELEVA